MSSNLNPSAFVGHYTNAGLVAALRNMDSLQAHGETIDRNFQLDAVTLARKLTGKYKPEGKVMTWAKRFIKLYYSPIVKQAFKDAKVSARYAYDICDYVEYAECAEVIKEACRGKFGNSEFRIKIKEMRNGN